MQWLQIVAGDRAALPETVLVLAAATLTFLLVLRRAAFAVQAANRELWRVCVVLVAGLLILGTVSIAVRQYVQPVLSHHGLNRIVVPAAPAAVLLACVVPLGCLLLRTNYLRAATAILLAATASAIVILMAGSALDAIRTGNREMGRTWLRTTAINRLLSQ